MVLLSIDFVNQDKTLNPQVCLKFKTLSGATHIQNITQDTKNKYFRFLINLF